MMFRGRCYLLNWNLELPDLLSTILAIARDGRIPEEKKRDNIKALATAVKQDNPARFHPEKFPWTATPKWPKHEAGQWQAARDAYRQEVRPSALPDIPAKPPPDTVARQRETGCLWHGDERC